VNKKIKVKNTAYPVLFYCTSSEGYEVMFGVITIHGKIPSTIPQFSLAKRIRSQR
jgi:hypothetical protein